MDDGGRDGADESFPDFVTRQQGDLLRLAVLLTGSRARAEQLVRTALADTCRRWHRISRHGDPGLSVRRALVAGATGWRARASGSPADDDPGPAGSRDDEQLRRALAALPRPMRAAVVLRCHEGLADLGTARLMGTSESTAHTRAARGLARLRTALSPASPGEAELAARLRTLADRAGPPGADGATVAWWIAKDTGDRRRRRRMLAGTAATVALLGSAVPLLVDGASPGDVRVAASEPTAPPDEDLYDGPPRGSMGDDGQFVAAVAALPWPDGGISGSVGGDGMPPADRQVVFAGDVPGGRWALVVARPTAMPDGTPFPAGVGPDLIDGVWFAGPPGATADQLAPALHRVLIKPAWSTELLDPATGVLVVVAGEGDRIEVSERAEVAADGSMSREYRRFGTTQGVAVIELATTGIPYGTAAVYRIVRGTTGPAISPWTALPDEPGDEPAIDYPRGQPPEPGRTAAVDTARRMLGEIGLPPDEVQVTAQWVGDAPVGGPGQAAVVTAALPSGAVVVAGHWLLPPEIGATVPGGYCASAVLPAGAPPARRVYALECEVVEGTPEAPMETTLVVVAPPDVELVRAYDARGRFVSEHPAPGGVLVEPVPFGAQTVEAVTGGGIGLGRTDILDSTVVFEG